jgi:putative ABC transport system permease protein
MVTNWLLPVFNSFAQTHLTMASLLHPFVIIVALSLIIIIAFLAGSYPAFIVAAFQPVKVLKGAFKTTSSGLWLRKSLIVFQFAISIFLVIATIVVQQQLFYIQHKDLGYDREHVVVTHLSDNMIKKLELVKTELKSNPEILSVSKAAWEPVEIESGGSIRRADAPENTEMNVTFGTLDEDYIKTCGLKIIAGNDLNRQDILDAAKDSNEYYHILINETACKALGWLKPEDAVNQKIVFQGTPGEIKGVVKDFHFASLHTPIEPLLLVPADWGGNLLIKVSGNRLPQTIAFIEKKYKEIETNLPFQFHFMDENYQKLYNSEMRTGKVFNLFSFIAVLLACMGLFGLSTYDIRQRTKEIGIRKVLGASVAQIMFLLLNNILKLVLLAIIIASPIAWWLSKKWLQGFAYRITISWWMFAGAAVWVIAIAFITVSFQSIKAAMANPARSLKTE